MKFTHPKDAPKGHKWQLRNGGYVKEVTAFNTNSSPHIFGKSLAAVCNGNLKTFYKDGTYGKYLAIEGDLDLVDVPVKHTIWINKYSNIWGSPHKTRANVDKAARADVLNRIACVKVTYTEGQFDD